MWEVAVTDRPRARMLAYRPVSPSLMSPDPTLVSAADPRPIPARHTFLALVFFVALATVHTWPLASAPGYWSRNDNGDYTLNAWAVAWVAHALSSSAVDRRPVAGGRESPQLVALSCVDQGGNRFAIGRPDRLSQAGRHRVTPVLHKM